LVDHLTFVIARAAKWLYAKLAPKQAMNLRLQYPKQLPYSRGLTNIAILRRRAVVFLGAERALGLQCCFAFLDCSFCRWRRFRIIPSFSMSCIMTLLAQALRPRLANKKPQQMRFPFALWTAAMVQTLIAQR
jgi:hypothetical protein